MVSIAFDTWILSSRYQFQGYWVYAYHLLKEFQKLAGLESSLVVRPFVHPECDNTANAFEASFGFTPVVSGLLRYQRSWRCGGSQLSALKAKADLLFSPTSYVLPFGILPIVSTIGDATPLKLPSHLMVKNSVMKGFTALAAKGSRKIVTFSNCSKKDLVELFSLPPDKVDVIYLSHNHDLFNDAPPDSEKQKYLLTRLDIHGPFILHHGTVQPRKNLARLIEAYRLLLHRRPDLDLTLVLSGIFGWQYEPIVRAGLSVSGPGKVVFTGPLDESDLSILVKSASLSVIPSLYEGFCLPMVEAMACGTVTVTSNNSCLPEVSGNVLRYFDPNSTADMADVMELALSDSNLRAEMSERGKQRARDYSWDRCGRETLNLLRNVASE